MRPDPHAGKYPEGPERVVEPGTPAHAAWVLEQARKRDAADLEFERQGDLVGRPKFWRRDVG